MSDINPAQYSLMIMYARNGQHDAEKPQAISLVKEDYQAEALFVARRIARESLQPVEGFYVVGPGLRNKGPIHFFGYIEPPTPKEIKAGYDAKDRFVVTELRRRHLPPWQKVVDPRTGTLIFPQPT